MTSRGRVTAALVALLVLVAVAWLVQQAASDEHAPRGGTRSCATGLAAL